jgi:hypothetical protein
VISPLYTAGATLFVSATTAIGSNLPNTATSNPFDVNSLVQYGALGILSSVLLVFAGRAYSREVKRADDAEKSRREEIVARVRAEEERDDVKRELHAYMHEANIRNMSPTQRRGRTPTGGTGSQ